jgi:hypothetical protein
MMTTARLAEGGYSKCPKASALLMGERVSEVEFAALEVSDRAGQAADHHLT